MSIRNEHTGRTTDDRQGTGRIRKVQVDFPAPAGGHDAHRKKDCLQNFSHGV